MHRRRFDNPQDAIVAGTRASAAVAIARRDVQSPVRARRRRRAGGRRRRARAPRSRPPAADGPDRSGRGSGARRCSVAKKKSPWKVGSSVPRENDAPEGATAGVYSSTGETEPLAFLAVVDERPAVVLPGLDDVDLVSPARPVESRGPVLGLDQQAGLRIPVEALRIAVAVARRPESPGNGLSAGIGAVGIQAQRLAAERLQVLRDRPVGRVPGRGVELAVRAEAQAAAGVIAARPECPRGSRCAARVRRRRRGSGRSGRSVPPGVS